MSAKDRRPVLRFIIGESRSGFRLSPRLGFNDVTATNWRRALDASGFEVGDRVVLTLSPRKPTPKVRP